MIRIVRKRFSIFKGEQGQGMYRCYCDECARWIPGHGRSRYLTWWQDKSGAERAADHHQSFHEASLGEGVRIHTADNAPPNSGEYEDISSIPTISAGF